MVKEAEEYAEEDKAVKDRIDARNSLESYLYNMKNLLDDEEKGVASKISEADKEVGIFATTFWLFCSFFFCVFGCQAVVALRFFMESVCFYFSDCGCDILERVLFDMYTYSDLFRAFGACHVCLE